MPLLVRHRTPAEQALAATTRVADLIDPYARNTALPARTPAVDSKRTQTGHANWLVVVGLCTHMGCPLLPSGATTDASDREIAWVCPCHAARFDYLGRVRSGPARTNLEVPAYRFVTPWQIRLE
jgi:ubiquinol-cytochrome c reductase iron-sulfur subunit